MGSILILGGTNFIGPHIVEAARARGHAVTVFNRGRTAPGLLPGVEELRGDRDAGDLAALAGRRWDAVIDTSGYVPRVVRQSTELLAPSVGRYVFVSSISVYARTDTQGSDEGAPLAALTDPGSEDVRAHYGALKALCERAVEAALPGRAAAIRAGLIVGPRDTTDRFTYWPVRAARGGDALAPGDGTDPVQFVDARDLAAWMVQLIERGCTGAYNATGPAGRLTMAEMLDACGAVAGEGLRWTWVDAGFLEARGVAAWSDLPVWIPATPEMRGFATVDCRRAIADGLRFRPLAETVRDTLAWWNGLPAERRAHPRAGLPADREAAVLATWRARPSA